MKIGFVIPARLKSTRLKRKILLNLGDQTALEWAIDRAKSSPSIDEVVVSTTGLESDSDISKICIKNNVRYYQGDPEDVLQRLNDTARYFNFDFVVNITPDNPLFSIHMIDLIVTEIKKNPNSDYINFKNAPLGTGIYALKKEALETICEFKNIADTEIWGPLFHKDYFKITELRVPKSMDTKYRLTMDTDADYKMLSNIFEDLNINKKRIVEFNTVINYLDNNPQVANLNKDIPQTKLDEDVLIVIDNLYKQNQEKFLEIKNKYYN